MKKILLLAALACGACATKTPRTGATKSKNQDISATTVARVIRTLAADDMGGRPTAAPGNAKAGAFLAAEFKRIGLQPFGQLGGYEQEFPAYQTRTVLGSATLAGIALPADNVAILSGRPELSWNGGSSPARLLVVGPQDNLLQQAGPLLDLHEDAVVLIDPTHATPFQRLRGYLQSGGMQPAKPAAHAVVFLLAPTSLAAGTPYQVAATTTVTPVMLRNIVGVLPGRDPQRAKEYVVFSAHYDHLGLLAPVAGDSIANGADDDASGTTAVVALAEYYQQRRDNARPLLFVAFTGEEIGGFGSKFFSRQLDPQQVVAMFNIEMIGKEAKFGPNTAFITGYERSDFGALLQSNLTGTPFRFEPDPYPEQNLFYRSDNATLARLGVPAHTISTDQIPDDKLYHSVDDEVESLNLPNMTAVISAIAQSARGLISGQQTPTRITPEPGK